MLKLASKILSESDAWCDGHPHENNMDMPAIFLPDGTSGDIRAVLRSIQAQMWEHAQHAAFNEEET